MKRNRNQRPRKRFSRRKVLPILGWTFILGCQLEAALAQWANNGTNIHNTNSGSVGVGTTAPVGKLHVEAGGDVRLWINSYSTTGTAQLRLGTPVNEWRFYSGAVDTTGDFGVYDVGGAAYRFFIKKGSGNVGIGTTSPGAKLNVVAATGTAGEIYLDSDSGQNQQLYFREGGSVVALMRYTAATDTLLLSQNSPSTGVLHLQAGGRGDDLFVVGDNVGIGTSTPGDRLHVAGNIKVDGNIAAKYQDVAEWVPSAFLIPAASVVVLDSDRSNYVLPSSKSYDTHVAGVITDRPGILLGEGGEGKLKVATTGRVKVRVDASQASIRIGDLLVTSDKAGVAMRSEPLDLGGVSIHRPGTLLGKALEPLAQGEGEILVLLSLQ